MRTAVPAGASARAVEAPLASLDTGEQPLTVLAATSFPTALAVGKSDVYWADLPMKGPTRGEIKRVSIHGGEPTILLTVPSAVRTLAIGGTSLYWTTSHGVMQLSPI